MAGSGFASGYLLGYLAALGCAFTWSGYSMLSRRLGSRAERCGGRLLRRHRDPGAARPSRSSRPTVWPSLGGWLAVLALGLGPVGIAFFVWDYGVKRGDIQVLGALRLCLAA